MADTTRKRSRKSKIVLRKCYLDSDSDDNNLEESLLNKFLRQACNSFDIKDEPTTSACPITEMYSTETFTNEMPMIHISEPPMKINVQVKVERCDDKIETCKKKQPKQKIFDQAAFWKKYKLRKFNLSNSVIVFAADKIKERSKSIADQILDVAVRNTSGHIVKGLQHNTFHNIAIQNALDQWKDWQTKHFLRDGPLFYKCYICTEAWWYLEHFKQHLVIHAEVNISIEGQSLHEINIIAYIESFPTKEDIFVHGRCGRCGEDYNKHSSVLKPSQLYTCNGCSKQFHTCLSLGFHVSNCQTAGVPETRIPCHICKLLAIPSVDNFEHLITVHSVRSDVPIITRRCQFINCESCNERYIMNSQHVCDMTPYISCDHCFRGFPTKTLLDLHLEGYSGSYQCPICEEKMERQCKKYEHMLSHSDKYAIVMKCILCIKLSVYLSHTGFMRHLKSVHPYADSTKPGFFTQIMIPVSILHPLFDTYAKDNSPVINDTDITEVTEENIINVKQEVIEVDSEDNEETVKIKTEMETEAEEIEDIEDNTPDIQIKTEPLETEPFSELTIKEEPIERANEIDAAEYYSTLDVIVKDELNQDDIDVYEEDIIKLDMDVNYETKNENDESQDAVSNEFENQSDCEDELLEPIKAKKIYRCPECGFEALHRSYKKHIANNCSRRFISTNQFICTRCDTSFKSLGKYLSHLTSHGYGFMTCPVCSREFSSNMRFGPHVLSHVKQLYVKVKSFTGEGPHNKDEFQCSKCSSIVEMNKFFAHWESHISSRATQPELTETKGSTPEVVELLTRIHKRTKQCCFCQRIFTRFNECKRHHIEHLLTDAYEHKDQYQELRCQICGDGFKTAEKYRQHMRDHASLPVYRCDMCDKSFSDSSNFTKHKKVHNFKVFVCDLCRRKFQSKTGLVKHLAMHMNTEPIFCEICKKSFPFDSVYRKHVKYHHNKEGVGYPCIICNIRFNAIKHKWNHMWEVHGERKIIADCPICHKSFRILSEVRAHVKNVHRRKIKL